MRRNVWNDNVRAVDVRRHHAVDQRQGHVSAVCRLGVRWDATRVAYDGGGRRASREPPQSIHEEAHGGVADGGIADKAVADAPEPGVESGTLLHNRGHEGCLGRAVFRKRHSEVVALKVALKPPSRSGGGGRGGRRCSRGDGGRVRRELHHQCHSDGERQE
jgi:hypothetical protein